VAAGFSRRMLLQRAEARRHTKNDEALPLLVANGPLNRSPRKNLRMPVGDDTHYYRGDLPHLLTPVKTYFVTFCTSKRFELSPTARDIVLTQLGRAHRIAYCLHCGIVMPDHVHLIVTPYEVTLANVLQWIKGASAFYVNSHLQRTGRLWQRESFDHILRNGESIRAKSDYVCLNPVRDGLVARVQDYPWLWNLYPLES
jgi:putative transposase